MHPRAVSNMSPLQICLQLSCFKFSERMCVQVLHVKDHREFLAFGSLEVFATNDAHVIVSGESVLRLTPDLKEARQLRLSRCGTQQRSRVNKGLQICIMVV